MADSVKLPSVLAAQPEDIQLLLAAQCHIGTKNCDKSMENYVWKRRADGECGERRMKAEGSTGLEHTRGGNGGQLGKGGLDGGHESLVVGATGWKLGSSGRLRLLEEQKNDEAGFGRKTTMCSNPATRRHGGCESAANTHTL